MQTKQQSSCPGFNSYLRIIRHYLNNDDLILKRNINWSSPEILSFSSESSTTVRVDQSADVWSLVMVLSEIFTGEIPYDSQYYRQMDIHSFNAAIKEGHRPKVPPRVMNITWLSKLVSFFSCPILLSY